MTKKIGQYIFRYLIDRSYRVFVVLKTSFFTLFGKGAAKKCNKKAASTLEKDIVNQESTLLLESKNATNKDIESRIQIKYNVYVLPAPQNKIPELKDASKELLRNSRFLVEYHKYLQKEFLEFSHG
ncbi:hypothetical protein [Ascidiimonas sp. W6]|uniref:hypothetical protein n=1 Tax=Ascidiimonas meishanensis TaxID=3128903 RepID=UPI0030EF9D6A